MGTQSWWSGWRASAIPSGGHLRRSSRHEPHIAFHARAGGARDGRLDRRHPDRRLAKRGRPTARPRPRRDRRSHPLGPGHGCPRGALHRPGCRPPRPRPQRRCDLLRDRTRVRGRRHGRRVGRRARSACWGTRTAASARSRRHCSPKASGGSCSTRRRSASCRPRPHVVASPAGAARRGRARRAARALHAGSRRPVLRADRPLAVAAGLAGPSRRGAHDSPRGACESANTSSTPIASGRCTYRRCCSQAATAPTRSGRPPRRCTRPCPTAGSRSCPGSDTPPWTPATELFVAEVFSFLAPE